MPNIGGKKFPYTPANMDAAREALGAQVSDQERRAIERAELGAAVTRPEKRRLRRMLGMTQRPTRAGTSRYGDVEV